MSYTPEMREMIKVVEASRPRRLHETYPAIPLEERTKLLSVFHPDYITTGMREIRVGVCKGQRTPHELAAVIEGRPHISPEFDLSQPEFETDVLIVGGGGERGRSHLNH
jgi:succinate dehydrogenase / fumarate reductase flavoprotein subunit